MRKARSKVFHLNCFTCMVCNKQLSTGEELYVIDENKFVCKDDYLSSSSLKEGSLNSGMEASFLSQRAPATSRALSTVTWAMLNSAQDSSFGDCFRAGETEPILQENPKPGSSPAFPQFRTEKKKTLQCLLRSW